MSAKRKPRITRPSPPAGELAVAYAGASMDSLARRYGVNPDTVRRWLRAAAIPIRSPGESVAARSRGVTPADRPRLAAAALDRYREGATGHEIAAELGVSPSTARRWIAQQGETLRRTGSRGRIDIPTALIVELHDMKEMSFAAIAEKVGMTKDGAAGRYKRYKRRLALPAPATKAAPPGELNAGRGLNPTPTRRSGTS